MADLTIRDGKVVYVNGSGSVVYSLPDSDGQAGQAVVTDGNGKLSFGQGSGIKLKTADGTVVATLSGQIL